MSEQTLRIAAPAKVNLYLGVSSEHDERGYHKVKSVMSALELYDIVQIAPAKHLSLSCVPEIDSPVEQNTAWLAAKMMEHEFGRDAHIEITIEKRIPVKSGLGGGSSDAAAVILALCELWDVDEDDPRVEQAARAVGADVPFFLYGQTSRLEGAGDELCELYPKLELPVVLVQADSEGVSTAEAYRNFDEQPVEAGDLRELCEGLREQDPKLVVKGLSNNLEPVALRMSDKVSESLAWLKEQPGVLRGLVTGAGACVYAVCESDEATQSIARAAEKKGWWSCATKLTGEGPSLL